MSLPIFFDVFIAQVRDSPQIQTALVAILVLMVIDFAMGSLLAMTSAKFKSAKTREGLIHKMSELSTLLLATVLDGTLTGGLNIGTQTPVLLLTCTYLILAETVSILEIVKELNPQLADSPIFKFLPNKDTHSKE